MNLLLAAGSVLGLAGVCLIHAGDWTGHRYLRWAWYPVTLAATLLLLLSRASVLAIVAVLAVAVVGGTLLATAFISAATGRGWLAVLQEMTRRQRGRRRPWRRK